MWFQAIQKFAFWFVSNGSKGFFTKIRSTTYNLFQNISIFFIRVFNDFFLNVGHLTHISMVEQVRKAIEWYGEQNGAACTNPAQKNLFKHSKDSPLLSTSKADQFHSMVAKLLYVAERVWHDIEPAIVYLCTTVSSPNVDDWKKLGRVNIFWQALQMTLEW